MGCNPNKKDRCIQGGFNQIPKNVNTLDSKGILDLFNTKYPQEGLFLTSITLSDNGDDTFTLTITFNGTLKDNINTLNVFSISPEDGGSDVDPDNYSLTNTGSGIWVNTNVTFIEPDNVVDLTYSVVIEALDVDTNELFNEQVLVKAN